MTTNHPRGTRRRLAAAALAALAAGGLLAACGGGGSGANANGTSTPPTTTAAGGDGAGAGGQVLPVTSNPIANPATAETLRIDSALVENNVDASGRAVDDHLEIAVSNTGTAELSGFEVFYTFDDPTAGTSESYYADLPAGFTVPAGGTRTIHFDDTGGVDHFPVNRYSLYYTSTNALDVTIEVSAHDAAPQTSTLQKDAGGAEVPD